MVFKGNGEWCFCGDYCCLNDIIILDCYFILYIQDFVFNLVGIIIFFKIDLVCVYYQIFVSVDDIVKMVIIILFGLYEFCCMFFGLRNVV